MLRTKVEIGKTSETPGQNAKCPLEQNIILRLLPRPTYSCDQ